LQRRVLDAKEFHYVSESKTTFIVLALFGYNWAGRILWGLIVVAGLAYFVFVTKGPPFSDEDERLFRAARHGDRAGVERSLEAGAGVADLSPLDRKTALFRAAAFGHADVVNVLLERGADPATRGGDGKTALDVVIEARADEKKPEAQRALDDVANLLRQARTSS
jgi:Ankyrin repeats (3 copies)